jgi:hypothetical protein
MQVTSLKEKAQGKGTARRCKEGTWSVMRVAENKAVLPSGDDGLQKREEGDLKSMIA